MSRIPMSVMRRLRDDEVPASGRENSVTRSAAQASQARMRFYIGRGRPGTLGLNAEYRRPRVARSGIQGHAP